MGRPLSKVQQWVNRMYLASLCCMLYTSSVYCIVSLIACLFPLVKQWVNLMNFTSNQNFFTQLFVSQTCHNSTKKGHKHVQTILAKSLKSDTSVATCFHWILKDSRILVHLILVLKKDTHLSISSSRLWCSMQPREGLCIGFLGVSHLALSSVTAALYSFRIFTARRVWVGCLTSKVTF